MRVDTKDKYDKVQRRRKLPRELRWAHDYIDGICGQDNARRIGDGLKPNHKKRAVSIVGVFTQAGDKEEVQE